MKITRIKTCNLASLAGVVELDLQKGALGQAGLFAITGPTGSGKTTILDAVCLALFDQTPRLQEADGRVKISRSGQEHDTLSAQSPRALLRHDAGSGYAEVDFLSAQGRPFCARWEVRRAGDKASGRLQQQKMSLIDLVTQEVMGSGTKTDTKSLIIEHLGLNFDQFIRSALLAQGQFASFLKAKRSERAELLERMTGTDLYARISEQAFAKNKAANQLLENLQAEKAELNLLTPIELATVQATLTSNQHQLKNLEEEQNSQRSHASWQQRLSESNLRLAESKAQLTKAKQVWQNAAPQREQVRRYSAAALQLERLAQLTKTQDNLTQKQEELQTIGHELKSTVQALKVASVQLKACREADAAAQATAHRLAPKIQQALGLEQRLQETRLEANRAKSKADQADAALRDAERGLASLRQEQVRTKAEIDAAKVALGMDPQAAALAPLWQRVHPDLKQAVGLQQKVQAGASLQQELLTAQGEHSAAVGMLQAAKLQRESNRSLAVDHQTEQPNDTDKLTTELARLEKLRLSVDSQEKGIAELKLQLSRTQTEQTAQQDRSARLAVQEADLLLQLPIAERHLVDRTRIVELGASTLQLAEHRHLLRPGEPCPLCGSPEHPGANPAKVVIDALVQEEKQAQGALNALQLNLGNCRLELAQARKLTKEAAQNLKALLDKQQDAQRTSQDSLGSFSTKQALIDGIQAKQDQLDTLKAARKTWASKSNLLSEELRNTEAQVEASETLEMRCRIALASHETMAQQLAHDTQSWKLIIERLGQELNGVPGLGEEQLKQSAEALLAAWSKRVPLAQAQQSTLALGLTGIQNLQAPIAAAEERQKHSKQAQLAAEGILDKHTKALGALTESLLTLGIQDPGARTKELRLTLDASTAATNKALEQHQTAQLDHDRADQRLKSAELLRTELSRDLVLKQEALNQSLETLSLDELHALQAWDSASRQQTEEQVASLQRALLSSETILGERHEELSQLQKKEPKLVDSDPNSPPIHERLSQLRTRIIELQLQLQLQQDQGTKKKSLINDITRHQEENQRWAVLSSLIGSASGDTFRQFAQGLTLESLVAHANRHLKELAPRYLLARVPGEDLELQIVDQHLAGDVRSVNSLSGGETFLTSLALALGLASLSASQTPVRTLFIDEGFGSLDRKSLDTALATLDALQAGGRQVGIISHVAGIADHIGVQVQVKSIAPGRSQVLLP